MGAPMKTPSKNATAATTLPAIPERAAPPTRWGELPDEAIPAYRQERPAAAAHGFRSRACSPGASRAGDRRIAAVGAPLDDLREAVATIGPAHAAMAPYLEHVRSGAYAIADEDVDALKAAGRSEDEIFEQTVAAAVDEGLRRLDAGLRALE